MKHTFYPRLAWRGIRKNRRLYLPYLLTCTGMVMMFYIMTFLETGDTFLLMPGGAVIQSMLGFGVYVIGIFALLFLFYTNSFLIRRRKKEFGLYNILGMGKRNLIHVMFWESLMVAAISIAGGLVAGIVFSKFAELALLNILHSEVGFTLTIKLEAIWITLKVFAIIFALILICTLWQIRIAKPIELLHSESVGEKPPRANYLFALAGVVILGVAYYLAVTIQDPITAMVVFFVAVIMVILATYLLFISGSVAILRLLQKKKSYYYKTNHFVSISSMVYRMKRNGAGLASICILCTMVLVTLSSTMCLYIGAENTLRIRYPRNIVLNEQQVQIFEEEKLKRVKEAVNSVLTEEGYEGLDVQEYRLGDFNCYIQDGEIVLDPTLDSFQLSNAADIWQIYFVPLEDYNRLMECEEVLHEGEALLYTTKENYSEETITIPAMGTLQIKKVVNDFINVGLDAMQILPCMYVIVPDFGQKLKAFEEMASNMEGVWLTYRWMYGFDLDASDEVQREIYSKIGSKLRSLAMEGQIYHTQCESVASDRADFYGLYGGLFFLGILLGIVFLFAAVLIIYYKQVSEGYEDQSRFEIMQNIGMTKREIRKSINSQVLTVFFLPLLIAGLHMLFAFPLIQKLLLLFSLTNTLLLILVTCGCFLVFGLFYVIVYRMTSKAYYAIVSGAKEER